MKVTLWKKKNHCWLGCFTKDSSMSLSENSLHACPSLPRVKDLCITISWQHGHNVCYINCSSDSYSRVKQSDKNYHTYFWQTFPTASLSLTQGQHSHKCAWFFPQLFKAKGRGVSLSSTRVMRTPSPQKPCSKLHKRPWTCHSVSTIG